PRIDVAASPRTELSARALRSAHDRGDSGVVESEHVVEHEHRPFQRGEPLEEHEGSIDTESSNSLASTGSMGPLAPHGRNSSESVGSGSGNHGPTYVSRGDLAARSTSIHSRETTVHRYA